MLRLLASSINALMRAVFHLLYHRMAWSYDLVAAVVSAGQWNHWARITLPHLAGPRVLELGYGPGHLQQVLLQTERHTYGIDESVQMSRQASHRLRRVGLQPQLTRGLVQHLPFASASMDQVVSTFPSEYIFDPRTLQEAWRVLRPGGLLVILPAAVNTRPGPGSWITKLLYRITLRGLASSAGPDWERAHLAPLQQVGFTASLERVTLQDGLVLKILAFKPGAPGSGEVAEN